MLNFFQKYLLAFILLGIISPTYPMLQEMKNRKRDSTDSLKHIFADTPNLRKFCANPKSIFEEYKNNKSLVTLAFKHNDIQSVDLLLQRNINLNEFDDTEKEAPLHKIIREIPPQGGTLTDNQKKIITKLINAGADINIRTADENRYTPLDLADNNNVAENTKIFLKELGAKRGADLDKKEVIIQNEFPKIAELQSNDDFDQAPEIQNSPLNIATKITENLKSDTDIDNANTEPSEIFLDINKSNNNYISHSKKIELLHDIDPIEVRQNQADIIIENLSKKKNGLYKLSIDEIARSIILGLMLRQQLDSERYIGNNNIFTLINNRLQIIKEFNKALRPEDFKTMKRFIVQGADPNLEVVLDGRKISLLELGILYSNEDFVNFLLKKPNIYSNMKKNPLNFAYKYNTSQNVINRLLHHGIQKDHLTEKIISNKKFHNIIKQRQNKFFEKEDFVQMQQFIEDGANSNTEFEQWGDRISLLTLGILHNNADFVEFLLKRNANPNQYDSSGETPLHRIMNKIFVYGKLDDNQKEMFESLLKSNADINIPTKTNDDYNEYTPLDLAYTYKASDDIIDFLINNGAQSIFKKTEQRYNYEMIKDYQNLKT